MTAASMRIPCLVLGHSEVSEWLAQRMRALGHPLNPHIAQAKANNRSDGRARGSVVCPTLLLAERHGEALDMVRGQSAQREAFHSGLKSYVPKSIWVGARRTINYVKRLRTWIAIARQVHGRTPADRAILNRSARHAVLNAIRNLDHWQDPILSADAGVTVDGVGDFELRAFSDDLYHVLPSREPRIVDVIHETLRPGGIFIDAGSNVGFYAILASRLVGTSGKVVAIEMMPDTAERLRLNCDLNNATNVEVLEIALSDRKDGKVIATVSEGKFGQASITWPDRAGPARKVSVRCGTLDDIMADFPGPIALVKMDLEGAELNACRGARAVLRRTETVVYERLGNSSDVDDLLADAGFGLEQLDGRNIVARKSAG